MKRLKTVVDPSCPPADIDSEIVAPGDNAITPVRVPGSLPIPVEAESSATLIDEAVTKVRQFGAIYNHLMKRAHRSAHPTLIALYDLSMRAAADHQLRDALMNRAQITVYKSTSHHLAVIRAVVKLADEEIAGSKVYDWSIVLHAWEIEQVEPTEEAVHQWLAMLAEKQTNSRRRPPLYETARKIVRDETKGTKEAKELKRRANDYEFHRHCMAALQNPIFKFKRPKRMKNRKGAALLLARIEGPNVFILGEVGKDEKTVRALWRQHHV